LTIDEESIEAAKAKFDTFLQTDSDEGSAGEPPMNQE